MRPYVKHATST